MKIIFPLTSAGSGSDVFVRSLVTGLTQKSYDAHIQEIPGWAGHFPRIAGRLCNSSGYDLIHTNTWNGYGFFRDIPMVTTEYHVVHDPLFKPYTTRIQQNYYNTRNHCKYIVLR